MQWGVAQMSFWTPFSPSSHHPSPASEAGNTWNLRLCLCSHYSNTYSHLPSLLQVRFKSPTSSGPFFCDTCHKTLWVGRKQPHCEQSLAHSMMLGNYLISFGLGHVCKRIRWQGSNRMLLWGLRWSSLGWLNIAPDPRKRLEHVAYCMCQMFASFLY